MVARVWIAMWVGCLGCEGATSDSAYRDAGDDAAVGVLGASLCSACDGVIEAGDSGAVIVEMAGTPRAQQLRPPDGCGGDTIAIHESVIRYTVRSDSRVVAHVEGAATLAWFLSDCSANATALGCSDETVVITDRVQLAGAVVFLVVSLASSPGVDPDMAAVSVRFEEAPPITTLVRDPSPRIVDTAVRVGHGEECGPDARCEDGLQCAATGDPDRPMSCTGEGEAGDTCSSCGDPCADGHVCSACGTCQRVVEIGELCAAPTSLECRVATTCGAANRCVPSHARGQRYVCASPGTMPGTPCRFESERTPCDAPLRCVVGPDDATRSNMVCATVLAPGAICDAPDFDPSFPIVCPGGYRCVPEGDVGYCRPASL